MTAASLFFAGTLASAQAPEDGRWAQGQKLAQSLCIACHGPQGLSVSPIWPSLAGQKYSYLVKAMKEYRNGVRQDPLMTPQAQTLTEAQIDAVSWYYSSMRVQIVETPQGAEPREN